MTYWLFDLAIVAFLLFSFWRGYRKGLILTLCGFLAIFVAFIGATMVSNALVGPVSRTVQPMIEQSIQTILLDYLPSDAGDISVPEEIPLPEEVPLPELPLSDALAILKGSPLYQGFADAFQKAVDDGMINATAGAARAISEYVARQLAQLVLFIVSFLLILVAWFFLSHALDLAFRLPVLSAFNRWSGGALGLFKGGLLLFIVCWLLKGGYIPQAAIEHTYLLNFFCTASPFSMVFTLIS